MNFIESVHCSAMVHCATCRTNKEFRQSLLNQKLVDELNFECPYKFAVDVIPKFDGRPKTHMEITGPVIWARWHKTAEVNEFTTESARLLETTLPCGECKTHLIKLMKEIPFRLNDQAQWMIDIHNEVNKKLGKPLWPYDNSISNNS